MLELRRYAEPGSAPYFLWNPCQKKVRTLWFELDIRLKQEAERLFESKYSRELFRQEFGRFYTEENAENTNKTLDLLGVQWI